MKILIEVDAVKRPNHAGYYVDVGAIRLVIEDGKIVGWYAPDGLVADTATMLKEKVYLLYLPDWAVEGKSNLVKGDPNG